MKIFYNTKVFKFILILFLASGLPLACEWSNSDRIYHPTAENIPQSLVSNISLDADSIFSSLSQNDSNILNKLMKGEKITEFGNEENDKFLSFTTINDMVYSSKEEHIFLLVDNLKKVIVFDTEGEYVTTIGQEGSGPGDFLFPSTLATDGDGNLYVLDRFEIDVFEYEGGKYKPISSISHNLTSSWDLCLMDDIVFVSGYSVTETDSVEQSKYPMDISGPIHGYNLQDGEYIRTFGNKYKSATGWPIFTGDLSAMNIECNSKSQTIISVFKHFPIFYGYDSTGKVKWSSMLDGYSGRKFYETNNSMGVENNGNPYDVISYFSNFGNSEFIIIQIENRINLPNVELKEMKKILRDFNPEIKTLMINSMNGEMSLIPKYEKKLFSTNAHIKVISQIPENSFEELNKEYTIIEVFSY